MSNLNIYSSTPQISHQPTKRNLHSKPGSRKKRQRFEEQSVLVNFEEEGVYRPKSKETKAAYEVMLALVREQLGEQPLGVIVGTAEEILGLLKKQETSDCDKRKVIEKLLNVDLLDSLFDKFVSVSNVITDFDDSVSDIAANEEFVAVEFEESDEGEFDMVEVEEKEEEEDFVGAMHIGGCEYGSDDDLVNSGLILNVQEIDAYWLQKKISMDYGGNVDAEESYRISEEVLKVLGEGDDERGVENKLLVHLGFDRFRLVKFLLRNRLKIVWCTRLARAGEGEEREKIEEEMMGLGLEMVAILEELYGTKVSA